MPTGVVTPEAVVLELPTAGVATRALARLVDLGVQLAVGGVLAVPLWALVGAGLSPALAAIAALVTVLVVVPIAVEILWRGRSPGKAIFGLRVVARDGSPSTPGQAAVRGLVAIVDTYLSFGFLAAATAMTTAASQRPGDLTAGTVVIRERSLALGMVPIAFHPPPGLEDYVRTLDVGALDDEDFALVRSFLLRSRDLAPEARRDLALRLAEGVRARIGHVLPATFDPEQWLVCVASAYQWRAGNLLADAALGLAPLAPAESLPTAAPATRPRR